MGTRFAYTSEHLSLAMLEYFVHLDADDIPDDLVVAKADIPESVPRHFIGVKQLPPEWRQTPAPVALTEIGDAFVRDGQSCILIVPSAIAPSESNWLINPGHPAFTKIRLRGAESFAYDARFPERPDSPGNLIA